jgi:hypothetical protein
MAAVAKFFGLSTAGDLEKTEKALSQQVSGLESRMTAVPGPSLDDTHYCMPLQELVHESLRPVTMCITKEKWAASAIDQAIPPKADLTGQMCVPTLGFGVGRGQDFDWVHFCSDSVDEVSVVAAAAGSMAISKFMGQNDIPQAGSD